MRTILICASAGVALGACTTTGADPLPENPPLREVAGECDGDAVQYHVGHTVSAAMGQAMLEEAGARTLRWVPPRTAVTMDYRPDRLTVTYDDDMVIERITCG